MEIVLVRHAESIWNAEGRWQGQTDVPLSEQGRAEAAKLGARLANAHFDRRIASDLMRTRDTAAAIGADFVHDPAWREFDLGAWGGLLHSEVRERFPDEVQAMAMGTDMPIGGAESMVTFDARVHRALDAVIASGRDGERVIVVTHGGVIRSIVMRLLGLRGRPLIGATNTSITHLRVDPERRVRIVSYNCGAHLDASDTPHDDEILEGAPDDIVRRVATRLGIGDAQRVHLHPPRPGSITRLVRGTAHPVLRSFATPAFG
ncbi:histidine phosphatase family protein [Sandaracinus amylolyticus]|uniref:histidine phosphatase family protein n=1 Tax=Sandaracinus amylolyticus TaxID=927083 RepID=UPI00146FF841|nr:histidine phosphatase family protein [Sandaracinus amylolyticus]